MDPPAILSYGSSPTSTAPIQRPAIHPQYVLETPYHMAHMAGPQASNYPPSHNFLFQQYPTASPPTSPFKHYPGECSVPRPAAPGHDEVRPDFRSGSVRARPGEQDEKPAIKYEPQTVAGPLPAHIPQPPSKTITRNVAEDEANEVSFSTHIDALMKVIQLKHEPENVNDATPAGVTSVTGSGRRRGDDGGGGGGGGLRRATTYPSHPTVDQDKFNLRKASCSPEETAVPSDEHGRVRQKRYVCDIKGCGKKCSQKTQLETHKRAHTGEKPYVCPEPRCGLKFSQRGNMMSHTRIHTGEKPFMCDICGKCFAQRGNLKPHRLIHSKLKPFRCIFDGCGKMFGQRGNLKNHHNKFHADKIQDLTHRFSNLPPGVELEEHDHKLFLHFAELYKNSNKGIKGRGRDRKIAPKTKSLREPNMPRHYPVQALPPAHQPPQRLPGQPVLPYPDSFGGHGVSRNGPQNNMAASRDQHSATYGLYEMDQASVVSTENTVTASTSPGTVYEEEHGRPYGYPRVY
ncbi:hypothetical protein GGS23DRAFT_605317 [Durotheca rogersii]|uniref:uncharacterized protein n=1 Tax=Durotheca rogersii TaxID=419775 RepID=UPI00221FAC46|nr:uncharacterized protein GGS23DRAFT_605317 [Durotheca rogersii]KAI5862749.1 hypothetical protein GGS23DRAFT_605317 [Durotheca rogersii]